MTDAIPEDVMQAGERAAIMWLRSEADGKHRQSLSDAFARAILSEREKSRKRVEELEAWVASRDKFIVDEGLWGDFVETLPLRETPQTFKRLSLRKEGTDA